MWRIIMDYQSIYNKQSKNNKYKYKYRRKQKRRLYVPQILMGIMLLVASIVLIIMAGHGTTLEDRDITPVVIMIPAALYCIFTKERFL